LEERLEVRLFHRTTRVLVLTEDGQIYYEKCQRALEELRDGENLLNAGRTDVVGKVRVSMPILFGRHCVTPILLELARQYPNLALDLRFSPHLHDGRLLALLDEYPSTIVDTFAVWPETQILPKRLRLIIDTLAEKLPDIEPED